MRFFTQIVGATLLGILVSSCAGYKLGNIPPSEMEGVKTIYVPMVLNDTLEPQLEAMVTNAILRRFETDGTYRHTRSRKADAILEVKVTEFERDPLRSARSNTIVTEEYRITIRAKASLTNLRTGTRVFKDLEVEGDTDFFVNNNLQEGERQAVPLAADKLAYNLVKHCTEGW